MKFTRIIVLFSLIYSLSAFTSVHKYYLSITEIEYAQEQKSLQMISRIFVDDFQKLLQTRYDKSIELVRGKNNEQTNLYIERYFEDKLKIEINKKTLPLKFIGKRYEDDLIICYFEATQVEDFHKVSVTNLILTDLYQEQKNLIHFKKGDETKSLMLMKDKPEGELKF
ncbi:MULTISPECIES: DUF6702 family protein [Mesonia]|uniref:Uncharacterized protein n=1 Tax=Mesonia oceanica TaxID=2687242 RepID=A0AC61Y9H1_9FLAO|nr:MULTISPECIES: DUF6702 family protein [Mesonia]MAN27875.1 hypothetical protein [Mesonia sp.]MAQ41054.1 hypothetical protein [Mesonia sp.]MBJ96406.1 hypothetical protein [Flavobacteriaceae bacterium]VVV01147.1 hypothetical protein FVB9532_02427 [Mesonia oceanica]|tara:strand:- start:26600 stop:27103 length:504 start_codon:yes stop_codon:yes gene_type:complete